MTKIKNPNVDIERNKQYKEIATLAKYMKVEFNAFYIIPESNGVVLISESNKNKKSARDIFVFNKDIAPTWFWGCFFTKDDINAINKFFKSRKTEIIDNESYIEFRDYDKTGEFNSVKVPIMDSDKYKYPDYHSFIWKDIDSFNFDNSYHNSSLQSLMTHDKDEFMKTLKNKKYIQYPTEYGILCFSYPMLGNPLYILDVDCIYMDLKEADNGHILFVLFMLFYETGIRYSIVSFTV